MVRGSVDLARSPQSSPAATIEKRSGRNRRKRNERCPSNKQQATSNKHHATNNEEHATRNRQRGTSKHGKQWYWQSFDASQRDVQQPTNTKGLPKASESRNKYSDSLLLPRTTRTTHDIGHASFDSNDSYRITPGAHAACLCLSKYVDLVSIGTLERKHDDKKCKGYQTARNKSAVQSPDFEQACTLAYP